METKVKKVCNEEKTEAKEEDDHFIISGEGNLWVNLNPEILALIFCRIPVEEMVRTVPFVCQSWREAVAGPYCWTEIDVEKWCRKCSRLDRIDSVVRRLVRRSKGTVRRISAYKLSDPAFSFIANSGKCLKVLQIPTSTVSDRIVVKHATSLSLITVLDISYCVKITYKGLEALGMNCKYLVQLKRNMTLPEFRSDREEQAHKPDESEALAISRTMPDLRFLELAYGRFSDIGLTSILTKCVNLRHLNIFGCTHVMMEGGIDEKCYAIDFFREPWDNLYEECSDDDEDGEDDDVEDVDTDDSSSSFG